MSKPAAPSEQCPACGAEDLSLWGELETWICDDCSYVVGETGSDEVPTEFSSNIDPNEIGDNAWDQSISVKDKSEANLVEVLSQVKKVTNELAVTHELAIRAAEIVVEVWEANFMHGRTKSVAVGASVYAASREVEQGIPPAIVADRISSDQQSVKDTYLQLKSELQLDIDPPEPVEYLGHIGFELGLPTEVEESAKGVLDGHSAGGNPVGIAAAALYVSSEEGDMTLREVAGVTGLTKETIWRHASKIHEQHCD